MFFFLIPQGTVNCLKKINFFISFIRASFCGFLKCIAVKSDFSQSQLQGFQSYCIAYYDPIILILNTDYENIVKWRNRKMRK
jgi:hypothetical protein